MLTEKKKVPPMVARLKKKKTLKKEDIEKYATEDEKKFLKESKGLKDKFLKALWKVQYALDGVIAMRGDFTFLDYEDNRELWHYVENAETSLNHVEQIINRSKK